jgi:hypothetical protein
LIIEKLKGLSKGTLKKQKERLKSIRNWCGSSKTINEGIAK